MAVRQLGARHTPALSDRGTAGEPLEAVAVIRARSLVRVALAVVRNPDVAELGMHLPVHRPPAGDDTAADPRADGDVDERVRALAGPPAELAERGPVHV